jgi:hypothetical protein
MWWTLGALAVLQCSMLGCSSGLECRADLDCASGFCKADGSCGEPTHDAGIDSPSDEASSLCAPDHNGMITLDEMPLEAGRRARFRFATNATFDTAGEIEAGGARRWDLSAALAGDMDRVVELESPDGAWWQAVLPTATYAVQLTRSSELRGVFRVDVAAQQVELLGVVSPEAGALRTELTYDPPARVVALPIQANAAWSSTSTISGLAQGVITAYSERYQSRVDQVGTMVTPYGEFPVLRIATDLTRTQGVVTLSTSRTFAWNAECFGTVASATSREFETGAEFTDPAEVRRLVP